MFNDILHLSEYTGIWSCWCVVGVFKFSFTAWLKFIRRGGHGLERHGRASIGSVRRLGNDCGEPAEMGRSSERSRPER